MFVPKVHQNAGFCIKNSRILFGVIALRALGGDPLQPLLHLPLARPFRTLAPLVLGHKRWTPWPKKASYATEFMQRIFKKNIQCAVKNSKLQE